MMPAFENPTTAVPPPPRPVAAAVSFAARPRPRSLHFAIFLAAIAWFNCARPLAGTVANVLDLRLGLGDAHALVEALLLLLLVVFGLSVLRRIEHRKAPLGLTLGLPRRATRREEWATGAAVGWGLAIASVIPMVLTRSLSTELWTAPRAFLLLCLSLLTLAVATLAQALAIYGYGFQRLIEATSPTRAAVILIAIVTIDAALTQTPEGTPDGTRILVTMLATLVLCLCWFRTHGLWLLWGLHFAWAASTGALFGLPIHGDTSFGSVVDTRAIGRLWLTGGNWGPAAAAFSVVALLVAVPILMRVTSDYAWDYTHPPIIAGGYEVTVAPPAAHAAMEQAEQPSGAGSLVQITPVAPSPSSAENIPE